MVPLYKKDWEQHSRAFPSDSITERFSIIRIKLKACVSMKLFQRCPSNMLSVSNVLQDLRAVVGCSCRCLSYTWTSSTVYSVANVTVNITKHSIQIHSGGAHNFNFGVEWGYSPGAVVTEVPQ